MEENWYLVTGANNGIGYSVTEKLLSLDFKIIAVDINVDRIENILNDRGIAVCCDLNRLEDIEEIFKMLFNKCIILSGFIHCAGLSPLMTLETLNIDIMLKTFNVNYFSFMVIMKYFAKPEFSTDYARVVGISSITRKLQGWRQSVYASSKAALENSIHYMASSLLQRKITIVGVSLGVVETDMFKSLCNDSDNLREETLKKQPLGILDVFTVADFITDLVSSPKNKYITGSIIELNGGYSV